MYPEENMKFKISLTLVFCSIFLLLVSCTEEKLQKVTVPFELDHNRMLVKA